MPKLKYFPFAATAFAFALMPPPASPAQCGFVKAFDRPDDSKTVPVYEGLPEAALTGSKPLAFVSAL